MKNPPGKPFFVGAMSLLLAAWFIACQSAPMRRDADFSALQGYWEGEGPGGECSITISGNSLYFHSREDFWYETTFTLPAGTDPPQLHATITKDSSPHQADIGKVVVALFAIEGGALTLAVIPDSDGPPPVAAISDLDWRYDRYHLKRGEPHEDQPEQPGTNRPETP